MRVPPLRASLLSCTGAATEHAQKPKRSFEDVMGGGAATSLGFGSALTVPQGFGAPSGTITPAAGMAYLMGPLMHNIRQQFIAACLPSTLITSSGGMSLSCSLAPICTALLLSLAAERFMNNVMQSGQGVSEAAEEPDCISECPSSACEVTIFGCRQCADRQETQSRGSHRNHSSRHAS